MPTLLAEVKTTFHNILAHPLWLYDPEVLERTYSATAAYRNGTLEIETDWELTPVRAELMRVKAQKAWKPLLQLLKDRSPLPNDWRRVVRLLPARVPGRGVTEVVKPLASAPLRAP